MVKDLIPCSTGGRQRFALKKEPVFDNFLGWMISCFLFKDSPLEILIKEPFYPTFVITSRMK